MRYGGDRDIINPREQLVGLRNNIIQQVDTSLMEPVWQNRLKICNNPDMHPALTRNMSQDMLSIMQTLLIASFS